MGVIRTRKGKTETKPIIFNMIKAQKMFAQEFGCAFLDLYQLSGGKDSIKDWYDKEKHLIISDHIHFTRTGSKKMANLIFNQLMSGFREFLEKKGYL